MKDRLPSEKSPADKSRSASGRQSNKRRFRPGSGVVSRQLEGEVIFLDLQKGDFLVARGLGPKVLQLLTEGISIEDVCCELCARYGVDMETVKADLEAFATRGVEAGILVEH